MRAIVLWTLGLAMSCQGEAPVTGAQGGGPDVEALRSSARSATSASDELLATVVLHTLNQKSGTELMPEDCAAKLVSASQASGDERRFFMRWALDVCPLACAVSGPDVLRLWADTPEEDRTKLTHTACVADPQDLVFGRRQAALRARIDPLDYLIYRSLFVRIQDALSTTDDEEYELGEAWHALHIRTAASLVLERYARHPDLPWDPDGLEVTEYMDKPSAEATMATWQEVLMDCRPPAPVDARQPLSHKDAATSSALSSSLGHLPQEVGPTRVQLALFVESDGEISRVVVLREQGPPLDKGCLMRSVGELKLSPTTEADVVTAVVTMTLGD